MRIGECTPATATPAQRARHGTATTPGAHPPPPAAGSRYSCLSPVTRSVTMLDLSSLAVGDDIHHPLLVVDVVARGGDHPRTVLSLGNRSGRIDSAPFWAGRDEAIKGIAKGML